jgi:alpha-glucosidase
MAMRHDLMSSPALVAAAAIPWLAFLAAESRAAEALSLRSPDGSIEVRVHTGDRLRYDVSLGGEPLIAGATLALRIDQATFGLEPQLRRSRRRSVDRTMAPPVRQKSAVLRERFNELRLELRGRYAVTFRAYDEGVAYRFETALAANEVKVRSEEAVFRFAGDWPVLYPEEEGFWSHNERTWKRLRLSEVSAAGVASLPAVVEAPGGVKLAVAESDLEEYPGLWLEGAAGDALAAAFPPYPLRETLERDRDLKVVEAAEYIAVTRGTRSYPWRLIGIARTDGDLLTNALVYLLASPSRVEDPSWIRPGKVAWDWWNALNLHGVAFEAGVNTETYKHYIDFASRNGLEYVILDEGWYELGDVLKVVPAIDMEELTAHARRQGVGLILWLIWNSFADKMEAALDQYARWGIAGLKIDFMQRDDQKVIDFYHHTARETAKRRMLVDFHGGQKPALMTRTWPHLITTEGVRGQEWVKWSEDPDPPQQVTLPFTRMFLGPMDFTPGATRNAAKDAFAPVFSAPMSRGTRCHTLAMYVVYESPLQMLADSPSNYEREPDMLEFLRAVPTVWDETRVLAARLGEHVVMARRSGGEWYVGAMTDWTPRELEISLDFLPEGRFEVDACQDGVNADRWGSDYRRTRTEADRSGRLALELAAGGGWAARIVPRP